MRRTHQLLTLSVLLIVSLLLAACPAQVAAPTGDAGTSAEGDGSTTITWAMWGSPAEIATHQSVADAFMAENPEIQIEIYSEPWGDYFTKIQTLWASGDPAAVPDVLFLSPIQSYAADGVLEPLDPYIEASGYNVDDYWPSLLEFGIHEGTIYGLPRDIGLEVLYYNKTLFDEAGLAYPDDSWTWDDLLEAADALAIVEDSGRVERYGLGMEGGKYQLWVGQNGGGILDDMHNPSRCILAEAEAVEAIEFFADMMGNNHAMRPADLSQAGGDAGAFAEGRVAMIIQNSSRVSQFNQIDGLEYDVAVVPIPEGGQRSASAGGAAWTMSALSDNKDAAWTFLQWLQGTDGGQRIYTESGEILPALQSTAKSEAFLGMSDAPANRQAFITEGENAKPGRTGYFAEWRELSGSILSPALDSIWAGEAAPADVLSGLCEQVDAFLADNGFPK
ncbi:sugar ABC transporter substrate-binding protein [Chloroflexi bacterium TSY]|nr:sugar ABC transporter substrate-binding protein [Chloroflexi bacterium TSY]